MKKMIVAATLAGALFTTTLVNAQDAVKKVNKKTKSKTETVATTGEDGKTTTATDKKDATKKVTKKENGAKKVEKTSKETMTQTKK